MKNVSIISNSYGIQLDIYRLTLASDLASQSYIYTVYYKGGDIHIGLKTTIIHFMDGNQAKVSQTTCRQPCKQALEEPK